MTFRNGPRPPYYAVVFMAELTGNDMQAYRAMGDELLALARQQTGFLGYEDLCAGSSHSFNVSYWDSLASIRAWKKHEHHLPAQRLGKHQWYRWYEVRITRVEKTYAFKRDQVVD